MAVEPHRSPPPPHAPNGLPLLSCRKPTPSAFRWTAISFRCTQNWLNTIALVMEREEPLPPSTAVSEPVCFFIIPPRRGAAAPAQALKDAGAASSRVTIDLGFVAPMSSSRCSRCMHFDDCVTSHFADQLPPARPAGVCRKQEKEVHLRG